MPARAPLFAALALASILVPASSLEVAGASSAAAGESTYWVDADGAAEWSDCSGTEPLEGPAACALETANASAVAGDTVLLRAGTYAGQAIQPSHSGLSDDRRIVFRNYEQETVTVQDGPYGILIHKQSYITVHGIEFTNLMRFLRIYGGHHNEIGHCDFDTRSVDSGDWVGALIADDYTDDTPRSESSMYNRVHHCTFYRWAYGGRMDRRGGLLDIGSWEADPVDESDRNLIEDNVFAYGGHHTLGVYSRHNVIRRNYFHNETNPAQWDYAGYRGAITEGPVGGYNLFEGNRFGYAGTSGLALRTPHNLLRFNLFHHTGSGGLQIVSSAAGQDRADGNRVYRNTFFHTGHEETDPGFQGGVYFANWSGQSPIGNVVKGNLFHDNAGDAVTYEGPIEPQVIEDNWDEEEGDPAFVDPTAGDPLDPSLPDLRLRPDSPCVDAAGFPTTVAGAAGSGTRIVVADAHYFVDGWGIPGVEPDEIQLTGGGRARITSVDYDTNTITVDRPLAWESGEGVGLAFEGGAPDYGADEFQPRLDLSASPGYRALRLQWRVGPALPATTTWRVAYEGPPGDAASPITGLPEPTRAYTLTGLTSGVPYTVTLETVPSRLGAVIVAVPGGGALYVPFAEAGNAGQDRGSGRYASCSSRDQRQALGGGRSGAWSP